jgi:predicted transposase/invertase (TIGR01784 family)
MTGKGRSGPAGRLEMSANLRYFLMEVLDPSLRPENIGDKCCILDIRLHTKSKNVVDIEIQARHQEFIWKRIQFYAAKMLVEEAKSGDGYEILPHVISILITDFVLILF